MIIDTFYICAVVLMFIAPFALALVSQILAGKFVKWFDE